MAKQSRSGQSTSRGSVEGKSRRRVRSHATRVITVRAQDAAGIFEVHVTSTADLEHLAEEWGYILRARPRWTQDPDARRGFRDQAVKDLMRIGIRRSDMKRLASVTQIEVELHKWDPTDTNLARVYEAASEIPWEYLISTATRSKGRFRPMLVTRLFRNKSATEEFPPPAHVLFVESAPGRLEDEYGFELERVRIRAAVKATNPLGERDSGTSHRCMKVLSTPSVSELKAEVMNGPHSAGSRKKDRWSVIHVTGVDTHQAARYIGDIYDTLEQDTDNQEDWEKIADSGRIRDGMILRESNIAELPVSYLDLARVLVNPKRPPYVVTLNLYHSGARTARELVGRGARVALGFLDEIDDELAERFFQAFYWVWSGTGGTLAIPRAFVTAWNKMVGDRLHGTAIAIWMGRSIFEESWLADEPRELPKESAETRKSRLARLDEVPVDHLLQVDLVIEDEINYSLLHNDRPLLDKLTLTKLVEGPLEDISVHVELNLGTQSYPYRSTRLVLNDDEPQLALASAVKIPLTAILPRSLRERVQSTVYVKVMCGARTAYEATERVTLIPVDEWVDDTDNNPWLPSFVLPRDPAVVGIIQSARRYLIGIMDDPVAGFDGYQSIDLKAKEPSAGVDAQVRAVWTAVVNDFRLQYINPPPSYSPRTQRLRTPSEVVQSNSGTCIDLTLLIASCLEYIDVYPVVVLLAGHAFVGYWRSEEAHNNFVNVEQIPATVPAVGTRTARRSGLPYVDRFGWRLTVLNYDEIMAFVTAGDLVMLEATYLTFGSSFSDAVEEGRANMRSRSEFDSLLDIRLARSAAPPVTPLPIISV